MHKPRFPMVVGPIAFCLLASFNFGCFGQEEDRRIPGSDEQAAALSVVKELFQEGYANRSAQLADQLFKAAGQTPDRTELYVLLDQSIQIAVFMGNVDLAWNATEQICEEYDVDDFKLKFGLVETLPGKINSVEELEKLFIKTQAYLLELVRDDKYEPAEKLISKISTIARKAKAQSWQQSFKESTKQIKSISRAFSQVKNALKKLESDPEDSDSNQLIGEFYCFTKNDFETGLPHLAKGNDKTTMELARLESINGKSLNALVDLADQWRDFGSSSSIKFATGRSILNYRLALEIATGLEKKRIEIKLAEISGASAEIIGNKWHVKWQKGHPTWEVSEFFSDGRFEMMSGGKKWSNKFTIVDGVFRIVGRDDKNTFLILLQHQRLACQKIDRATGRIVDRGVGTKIKP